MLLFLPSTPLFHNFTTYFPKIYIQQPGKRKIPKKTVTETKPNPSYDTWSGTMLQH